ncbi:cAMP-responsive element modulator [Larimichthys crocea]|uniref:Uncharacterized protein n=1 Tax=Larimichthys crocea TaxID=215358 RepID=A0ACD3QU19_LARCR|nr:cAMP-responsive element modulator [Larimichthys crocea]
MDDSLNDSLTDGEEDHSEGSPSPQVSVAEAESPGVTVVTMSDGQMLQVQGVIQAPQTSVIQSVQIATVAELDDDAPVTDTQKRREILSRRPSYRKILNELSTDSPAVPKIDEEKTEEEAAAAAASSAASASGPTSIYQTSSGQYIAFTQGRAIQLTGSGAEALQGSQTLAVASSPTPQPGAAILQCAGQPGDSSQQYFIQGGQVLIQERCSERQAASSLNVSKTAVHKNEVKQQTPGTTKLYRPAEGGCKVDE